MSDLYYSEPGIEIYLGDCAEIAPQLGAHDLLCSDPPYGIREARRKRRGGCTGDSLSGGKGRWTSRDYGASDWDDATPDDALLTDLRSRARWQCLFGGNYFVLPTSKCWLVWDKENGATDFADAELAWTNYDGAVRLKRHLWNGLCRAGLVPRYHPTQKPLAIMTWAISLCPERPASIIDPFMGSGTTLVAAKNLGIRAVGIERERKYVDVAVQRLAQQTMFAGVRP